MVADDEIQKRLVKFTPERIGDDVPHIPELEKIIYWGKILDRVINFGFFAPKSGNVSVRWKNSFIITNSGTDLNELNLTDFSWVTAIDSRREIVYFHGQPGVSPSSETRTHHRIYQLREDVRVIFHIHDYFALALAGRLNLPITKQYEPLGSLQLAKQISRLLSREKEVKIFAWKEHGICALGSDVDEAAYLIALTHLKAEEIQV